MNDLIKISNSDFTGTLIKTVNARELHEFLQSKQDFSTWIKNRIEKYGFKENVDYVSFHKIVERENGGTTKIEYHLTMDMAKELSMVENNEQGRKARLYFIQCEKDLEEAKKGLNNPENKFLSIIQKQNEMLENNIKMLNHLVYKLIDHPENKDPFIWIKNIDLAQIMNTSDTYIRTKMLKLNKKNPEKALCRWGTMPSGRACYEYRLDTLPDDMQKAYWKDKGK